MIAHSLVSFSATENDTETKILQAAQRLFARQGYNGTTTRDLAQAAGVAEGTLFRYFDNKKAILGKLVSDGWVELLTDLLTELSEMPSYKAINQVMGHRFDNCTYKADLMRICFTEIQFHPDLQEQVQRDVVAKMTDVAEAFFQTAIDRGIYRPLNARVVAQIFLGMFAIAGFSQVTFSQNLTSPHDMQALAEGLADIFLNGVLQEREFGCN